MIKISFDNRYIHDSPLEVLQHLYYYTAQYGLSVAQFTGAHQKYWEGLPKLLADARGSEEELNSIIKQLETYSKGAKKRLDKRREQKDGKWAEKEIVLNAQLISVLAAYPFDLLSLGFKELTGDKSLPPNLHMVKLVMKKENGKDAYYFVDPDMLLLGNEHLLMIEIKTRGGTKSSRSYPPSQLLNYFQLIVECQNSNDNRLPTNFTHLIIAPSTDIKYLERHEDWIIDTRNEQGRLIVDPDGCIKTARGKSSYDYECVKDLLINVPIYYRSWEELEKSFKIAVAKYNDKGNNNHWNRLCRELTMLSSIAGKYK